MRAGVVSSQTREWLVSVSRGSRGSSGGSTSTCSYWRTPTSEPQEEPLLRQGS